MYKYTVNFNLKRNRVTIWRCPISPQYKNSHFFFIFRQAKNGGIKNCINLIRYIKRKRSGIWQQSCSYIIATKRRKPPPWHLVPDFNTMCMLCILAVLGFSLISEQPYSSASRTKVTYSIHLPKICKLSTALS